MKKHVLVNRDLIKPWEFDAKKLPIPAVKATRPFVASKV
jgi:hypothetical protein